MYVFIGKFKKKKKKKKKGCFAPLCVPLGLKKPGDFTVSESHGLPLNIFSALFRRAAQGFFFLFFFALFRRVRCVGAGPAQG
jgi:hypothetical protein